MLQIVCSRRAQTVALGPVIAAGLVVFGIMATPESAANSRGNGWQESAVDGGLTSGEQRTAGECDPEPVGRWPYGPSEAVAVSGDLLVFGTGTVLKTADISDPEDPQVLGEVVLPGLLKSIVISGRYAFVANGGGGLRVVDIDDPSHPAEVGSAMELGDAIAVSVAGDYAYVADKKSEYSNDDRGMVVYDVSSPENPHQVGELQTSDVSSAVAVADGFVYLTSLSGNLRVIDVSTPMAPVEVGIASGLGYLEGLAIGGDYVYLAAGGSGLRVIDVRSPSAPVEVGWFETYSASGLAVVGNLVFLAGSRLIVIDVSTPSMPIEVARFSPGFFGAVVVDRGYAYLLRDSDGVVVVDVSGVSLPVQVATIATFPKTYAVAAADHYVYAATNRAQLRVFDLGEPLSPVEVGFAEGPDSLAQDLVVDGEYAYMVASRTGLVVFDVSQPSHPFRVASLSHAPTPYHNGIAVEDGYAYVTYGGVTLLVIDVRTPTAPVEVGSISFDGWGYSDGVAVEGGFAYVAAGYDRGVKVVDISEPSNPVQVATIDLNVNYGVDVHEGFLYALVGSHSLHVIDVSDPLSPIDVGSVCVSSTQAEKVVVEGGFAYVVSTSTWTADGVRVIDVSVPTSPVEVGGFSTPGDGLGIKAADGLVYVADGNAGFEVFRQCPAFADGFESGDTSAWTGTVVDLAGAFNGLLIGRGLDGPYVECTYDPDQSLYSYLGVSFSALDGGLGGIGARL